MRVKVISIIVDDIENRGCNNGNYPGCTIYTNVGKFHGKTCACQRGCSNTWCLPAKGEEFESEDVFWDYVENK